MVYKDGLLNLLVNVPEDIKSKLAYFSRKDEILKGQVELVVLFGISGVRVQEQVLKIGGKFEDLGFGFGIITIPFSEINSVASIKEIEYIELPKVLFTNYLPSNVASCINSVWEIYKLTGDGVLMGFIDSGIDYTLPAFIDESGNTRIEYIHDLTLGGMSWDKVQINKAIHSTNPFTIVPETDDIGHGTAVAGVACAGGKIEKTYYGVAYTSSIAMVKMTRAGKVNYASSTQLMRGIKILLDLSNRLSKPLVMNLSFSTNDGAHDGTSLLEQYVNTVSGLERVSFTIATGNEGDSGHHVGGILKPTQSIGINISSDETVIIMQLYKNILDDINIEIKNSIGQSSGVIEIKKGFFQGNLSSDKYFIYDSGAKPFSINGEIIISFVATADFLTSGVWTINISSMNSGERNYNIWLPISEGLNPKTRFTMPNPYNTLGIPATVDNIISVGSYNFITGAFSSFSGRGRDVPEVKNPTLTAPGEGIQAPVPGGGYDSFSGTSLSAPQVAGACALIMQWGLVLGNDPYMYGQQLKYFLIKSAKRDRQDVNYPSPLWGYGTLCLRDAFELIFQNRSGNRKVLQCGDLYINENYENLVVEYQGDIVDKFMQIENACAFILNENYAVVSIENTRLNQLLSEVKEIVYVQEPLVYTLNAVSALESANITKFHNNPYLTLTGRGVLMGMIDTGIDYLDKEFMYEDNTTRILKIWDQTINTGPPPKDFNFGTEYTKEEINRAIGAKNSGGDPYSIVPSRDEIGHGTKCAGIMAARGQNIEIKGAAPDSELVVVKLKQARKSSLLGLGIYNLDQPIYENTDMILGLKYLYDYAREVGKPMVIHVPLGTNGGGHDGSSIIERYIDDISKNRGIIVVTGTGNEGDGEIHTSGKIEKTGDTADIELKVDDTERELTFWIWVNKPDKVSLGVVSPTGEVVDKIPAKLQEVEEVKFVFEGSTLVLKYLLPEEVTGDEVIRINIKNIRGGIWRFVLYGDYIVDGTFNAWLPQRSLLKDNTRFISPSPNITLTLPSTSRMIITTAYYNQDNNSVVAASGRGYTRDNRIKPEIAAGGIDILTTATGGGTTLASGSSAASSVVSGAVALMLQWGIVDGNDPTLYSPKIKTYLIRGAVKRPGFNYPNPLWGYGFLDLNGIFESVRSYI